MSKFNTLEPVIDTGNRITFLLDWEITTKCNLDCSYCGPVGGHDNSKPHPPLDECLRALKFMYEYVDLYMEHKPKGIRHVILNLYGGESLHHPHILEIIQTARELYQTKYQHRWNLTVTTTTNAIISEKKFDKIIPLIDEFTCSYHTECSDEQKEQFKFNLLKIKDAGKRLKCIVLMNPDPDPFDDAKRMVIWLNNNNIRYLPRQIDPAPPKPGLTNEASWAYNTKQAIWLKSVYDSKSNNHKTDVKFKQLGHDSISLNNSGRACCGGRQLCHSQEDTERKFFVENVFPDWYCSVNEFFVYIRQTDGEIFVNKDCKMNYSGSVGPIGNLKNYNDLLEFTRTHLSNGTMPTIQCKKQLCLCGLCAPKAQQLDQYNTIMKKYKK